MGCDIHAYVEHSRNGEFWHNLTDNYGTRDYLMFGIMAGVRREDEKLFDPKGLPEGNLSWATEAGNWRYVAPDDHPEYAGSDGWVSRENADRWIADGYSQPVYVDGVLKRVSDPDNHSHSWLTASELSQCLDRYRELSPDHKPPTLWVAILAAMEAIEGNGEVARVVFWFDN